MIIVMHCNINLFLGSLSKVDCEDISSYLNCKLILSKNMCEKYGYFCCKTCRTAGFNVRFERKKSKKSNN